LDNGKGPSRKNKLDAKFSLFFHAPLLQNGVPPFSKSKIEVKARSIAKTFNVESTYELPPPLLVVKITGLYILLSEIDIVTDMKLLEKPKNTMTFIMKLETNGTLGNLLVSTFGQWYLYPPMSILQLL